MRLPISPLGPIQARNRNLEIRHPLAGYPASGCPIQKMQNSETAKRKWFLSWQFRSLEFLSDFEFPVSDFHHRPGSVHGPHPLPLSGALAERVVEREIQVAAAAILFTAFKKARALASTLSVETPRPRYIRPPC